MVWLVWLAVVTLALAACFARTVRAREEARGEWGSQQILTGGPYRDGPGRAVPLPPPPDLTNVALGARAWATLTLLVFVPLGGYFDAIELLTSTDALGADLGFLLLAVLLSGVGLGPALFAAARALEAQRDLATVRRVVVWSAFHHGIAALTLGLHFVRTVALHPQVTWSWVLVLGAIASVAGGVLTVALSEVVRACPLESTEA